MCGDLVEDPATTHNRLSPTCSILVLTITLGTDLPTIKFCCHGTLPRFSSQGCHLSVCYYHQDQHLRKLHPPRRIDFLATKTLVKTYLRMDWIQQTQTTTSVMFKRHQFSGLVH
jgi:hypothetical protein